MSRSKHAGGFTLMEIVIAVAIVAVMAGALTPVVYKQMNAVRSEATSKELDQLKDALLEFYEDTGRFPTEGEGLAALVTDPGVNNWQGPYFSGSQQELTAAVSSDAFNRDYVYDIAPRVSPPTSVDLLLASSGANRTLDMGRLNRRWNLAADEDDLFALIATGAVNRAKEGDSRSELEDVAEACREFFTDNAAFPGALADLSGTYLDAGFQNENLRDAWNSDYLTRLLGAAPSPSLLVYSSGPDQQDDRGSDDDLGILVSSIPPGRRTATFELEIAQAALNAQPSLPLGGSWSGASGIRGQLGLTANFDLDGWGTSYGVNASARVIFSPGPDGSAATVGDNIPLGVGP